MATTNLGRVSVLPKGDYSATTAYTKNDIVTYNGGSYICKASCTGIAPGNTTYWQTIALKGDTGATGQTGAQGPTGPTGNGISSITKTGTSGLVDTYTITFTDGTTTTFTVTNGEDGTVTPEQMAEAIEDALADFATGTHENMVAGTAEQLLSDIVTTDKKPYKFRRTGADATREYDTLVGGSVVNNQLVDSATTSVTLTNGHKYYTVIGGTATIQAGSGTAVSVTGGTDTVTDLTAMFGSTIADYAYTLEQATAGSGIEWLKSYGFFAGYQAYNAGSMAHVSGIEAHVMTGFNAWDEEYLTGYYNSSGVYVSNSGQLCTKNKIRILPNTDYYIGTADTLTRSYTAVCFYDENETFISRAFQGKGVFTTPANAAYMTVNFGTAYGGTYKNDLCINLSNSAKNGTYEPYTGYSYTLDDTLTLRGILKLSNGEIYYDGDTYAHDGTVTRQYALVDLGALNWEGTQTATDSQGHTVYYSYAYVGFKFAGTTALKDAIMTIGTQLENKPIAQLTVTEFSYTLDTGGNGRVWLLFIDQARSAAEVKSFITGEELVAKKDVPTTESATPYQSPQICDPDGTEQYITDGIPVGHTTNYPANLKGEIERVMVQVPKPPTSNGTYTLKCTVASSGTTYAWTT